MEIGELLQYLLNVVNDFHLAILALQESYPLTDALDIIRQLREAMIKQCREIEGTFLVIDDCAGTYYVIVGEMNVNKARVEAQIRRIKMLFESTLHKFPLIDSGFVVGEQYFRQTMEKIASAGQRLEQGKK